MFIESDCLNVLLVHVSQEVWLELECVCDERSADPCSPKLRIDEQRLHVVAVEQHESDRNVGTIEREIERGMRKEGSHFGVYCASVLLGKKVVRGVH